MSLNPDDRARSLGKYIMSIAPDPIDVSGALSSLPLGDSEHQGYDFTTMNPTTEVIDGSDHVPASLLNLPREIRDMIYELVAVSCEALKPPNVESSKPSGSEHLFVAEGRWKIWSNEVLPRYEHSYNNLLLVNRQINAEIALAARLYLPSSICIGTPSANRAILSCFEPSYAGMIHLDAAKAIVLSLVDADMEKDTRDHSVWVQEGLHFFFRWYKRRLHKENPPRLIVIVGGFYSSSLREEYRHARRKAPIHQLYAHLDQTTELISNLSLKASMEEFGWIFSEEIVTLLRSRPNPGVLALHLATAIGCVRMLTPWAELGSDQGSIPCRQKLEFRRMGA